MKATSETNPKHAVAHPCASQLSILRIAHEGLRYHGIYYFVPGILNHFDTETIVALAAPRPLLFLSGEKDPGAPVDGIRVIEQRVARIYRLYGRERSFQSVVYPGIGHVYTLEMWEKTMTWLDKELK